MGKIAALPIVGMVLGKCAQAGLIIISKIAMSNGMSNLIFLCYSNALPTLILLPISLAFHKSERPPLTFSIISWFFLLGLIGFMAQFLGYAGIKYSSPTLSRAMLNLIPAFTFVLAVIFRWIAVLYSGVFGSAFQVGASTWCLRRTGPVFVAMFKHLGIVVAVVIGVTFLGDTFYLGRVTMNVGSMIKDTSSRS